VEPLSFQRQIKAPTHIQYTHPDSFIEKKNTKKQHLKKKIPKWDENEVRKKCTRHRITNKIKTTQLLRGQQNTSAAMARSSGLQAGQSR
jgi:hypothetical protein